MHLSRLFAFLQFYSLSLSLFLSVPLWPDSLFIDVLYSLNRPPNINCFYTELHLLGNTGVKLCFRWHVHPQSGAQVINQETMDSGRAELFSVPLPAPYLINKQVISVLYGYVTFYKVI